MPHRPLPRWLRPWLRISVRGLIVLVLIIGAGLGWIVQGARIQREVVAAIRRDGGAVLYDWEWKDQFYQSDGKPGAPKWLVDRLGVDYFGHAVSVSLRQPGSPSALRNIGQLSHVESLSLHGPFVTDAGLAHLKGLTKLEVLRLGDTLVTDAGLAHLAGMTIGP